jgi:hypothetical protein
VAQAFRAGERAFRKSACAGPHLPAGAAAVGRHALDTESRTVSYAGTAIESFRRSTREIEQYLGELGIACVCAGNSGNKCCVNSSASAWPAFRRG